GGGRARDLKRALRAGLHGPGPTLAGTTPEARAPSPTRPQRHEDRDEPVRVPVAGSGVEPLKLPPPEPADASAALPTPGDGGDWVDYGVLSLSDAAASGDGTSDSGAESERSVEPAVPAGASAADEPSPPGAAPTLRAQP